MAGSSSIQGDQTVTFTDNLSFDGTDRGGAMSADGQLWIGSATSNRADNGGHVRLGTLTAGTGMTVTNGPGTITLATTASLTDLHTARFIVASSTLGTGANFTSIAAAIAAAQGTGINSTIFLQPGTYTENITLVPGINLCAYNCDPLTPNVTISGTLTLTAAGTVSISGIRLQTNSAAFLAVTGNQASIVNLKDCFLNCSNSTGITYSSSNASSKISLFNCRGNIGTTGIGFFTHSSSGNLNFNWCSISNTGSSTTASTCSAGVCDASYTIIQSPITLSSTAAATWQYCDVSNSSLNTTMLTLGGSGIQNFKWTKIESGSASATTISTTATFECCDINSTNTNAIAGNGTLTGNTIQFNGTSSGIQSTITLSPKVFGTKGVFTPTVVGVVTGVTAYATQAGYYTVIGKMCFVRFTVATTSATGTGDLIIGGLPFTIKNDSNGSPYGTLLSVSGAPLAWPAGTTMLSIQGVVGTTTAKVYASGTAVAGGYLQMANTTINLQGSLVYEIE